MTSEHRTSPEPNIGPANIGPVLLGFRQSVLKRSLLVSRPKTLMLNAADMRDQVMRALLQPAMLRARSIVSSMVVQTLPSRVA